MNDLFKNIELELEYVMENKFKNILLESRGVYDKTIPIIDELYSYLKDNMDKLQLVDGEKIDYNNNINYNEYRHLFNHIKLNTDSFLNTFSVDLTIKVYDDKQVYQRDKSAHCKIKNSTIIQSSNVNKLDGCTFILDIPCKNRFTLNFGDFSQLMIHELHHAYRVFKVFSSNNQINIDKFYKSSKDYNSFQRVDNVSDVNNDFLNTIKNILYQTDDDEINAIVTEIYTIVKNNPDINSKNYRNYLMSFDAYQRLKDLETTYEQINDNQKYLRRQISLIINSSLNQNNSEQDNLVFLLKRIANRIITLKEKIYNVLEKALMDFNRIVTNESLEYGMGHWGARNREATEYSLLIIKYASTYL